MLQLLMDLIIHLVDVCRSALIYDIKWPFLIAVVRSGSSLAAILLTIVAYRKKTEWWKFAAAHSIFSVLSLLVRNDLNSAQVWYVLYHISLSVFLFKLARCTAGGRSLRKIYVKYKGVESYERVPDEFVK